MNDCPVPLGLENWLRLLEPHVAPETKKILVANKCDNGAMRVSGSCSPVSVWGQALFIYSRGFFFGRVLAGGNW